MSVEPYAEIAAFFLGWFLFQYLWRKRIHGLSGVVDPEARDPFDPSRPVVRRGEGRGMTSPEATGNPAESVQPEAWGLRRAAINLFPGYPNQGMWATPRMAELKAALKDSATEEEK